MVFRFAFPLISFYCLQHYINVFTVYDTVFIDKCFFFSLWFITNLIKMRLNSINALGTWNFNDKFIRFEFEFQITQIWIQFSVICSSLQFSAFNMQNHKEVWPLWRDYIIVSVLIQMMDPPVDWNWSASMQFKPESDDAQ